MKDLQEMHCFYTYFSTWICDRKKGADIEKLKNIMKITEGDVNVNIKEIKKPELTLLSQRILCNNLLKSCLQKGNEKSKCNQP